MRRKPKGWGVASLQSEIQNGKEHSLSSISHNWNFKRRILGINFLMPWFYSLLFHKSHHRMEMRKKIVFKKYPYCLNFDINKDETKKSVSERIFFGSINLYCFSFVLSWFYWFLKFPCFFHSAWFYFLHHNKNQNSNSPGSAFV